MARCTRRSTESLGDMRNLCLLFALLLLGACTPESAGVNDPAVNDPSVLTAALNHFFAQPDSVFGPREGVVLIRSHSDQSSTEQSAGALEETFHVNELSAPREAFENLTARRTQKGPFPVLGDIGIAARYDNRYDDPVEASTELKEHVPTIVSLQRPGYANHGRTAVVTFEFTWSMMHAGWAYYVLELTPKGQWRVVGHNMQIAL